MQKEPKKQGVVIEDAPGGPHRHRKREGVWEQGHLGQGQKKKKGYTGV